MFPSSYSHRSDIVSANKEKSSSFIFEKKQKFIKLLFYHSSYLTLSAILYMYANPVLALSNKTSNIIHGTAPYLTFDNGQTKSTDTKALSWISFIENGREVKHNRPPVDNDNNPLSIALPTNLATFADIKTIVPVDTPIDGDKIQSIDFIKLLQAPYNYGRDDDGDVINSGTGKIQMTIVSATGQNVARTDAIDKCLAPYNIKLKIENSSIQTQYGVPNTAKFSDLDDNYILTVGSSTIYTCFVQPNTLVVYENQGIAGEWDTDSKAFLVQDINNPESNFPATGGNNVSFKFIVAGLDSYRQLSYTKEPSNSNIDLEFSETQHYKIPVVTLKGPNANSPSYKRSFVPTQFTIYADRAKTLPIYRFKLRRWFIPQINSTGDDYIVNVSHDAAVSFCSSLAGYRMPTVADMTNANGSGWNGGYPGNGKKPLWQINGGLASEWGELHSYKGFTMFAFWTGSPSSTPNQYYIVGSAGSSISSLKNQFTQAICVSP